MKALKPKTKCYENTSSTIHVGQSPRSISFAGCGFLGVYHIGVASCLKKHAKNLVNDFDKIFGCSAGSLIGAMLLIDYDIGEVCEQTMNIVTKARSGFLGAFNPSFRLNNLLLNNLREKLPTDAHLKATGRLHVSLTRIPDGRNVIVSDFASRDELIQVLLCSCFVPLYSGLMPPKYRGVYYIDGGLSNNLPSDSDTITVSPWSGGSNICPKDSSCSLLECVVANTSIQMTPDNFYRCCRMFIPSNPSALREFCSQGFQETAKYLRDHGLFEATEKIRSNLSFSTSLNQLLDHKKLTRKFSHEDCTNEECKFSRLRSQSETNEVGRVLNIDQLYSEFTSEEKDDDPNVLTVINVYPIEIESQLLREHMVLPQTVLQALENAFEIEQKNKNKLNHRILKTSSFPFVKAYQLSCFLLQYVNNLPQEIPDLFNYLRQLLVQFQQRFNHEGHELVSSFHSFNERMWNELDAALDEICYIFLVIIRQLLNITSPFLPSSISYLFSDVLDLLENNLVPKH